jgi:hypothetical protein
VFPGDKFLIILLKHICFCTACIQQVSLFHAAGIVLFDRAHCEQINDCT